MTDIKMLPLPDELRYRYGYMGQAEHDATVGNYARSVAEHNIAARDAEIEALRAEREVIGAEAVKYAGKSGRLQAELDNRWATGVHTCHDKCQRIACVLRRDNERLADALRDLEPFAQHQDSCGDHDAYNNSPIRTCGCGLDSLLERIAALRDHDQEVGNG